MTTLHPARLIQDCGVSDALSVLAGPFGLRRFVIHFELVGAQVRVTGLEAVPLRMGGGPPPPDLTGERMESLEQALGQLHRTMDSWRRGAIGYTRNAKGKTQLFPVFGEESLEAGVDRLPIPGPPAHPLETPEFQLLRESLVAPCREVHTRSQARGQDWEDWEIKADTHLILYLEVDADGEPTRTRSHRCQVLGTFEPPWSRFTWRVDQPLFPEKVFAPGDFSCTWDAAMELGLLSTTRLRAEWLFVQPIDDRGSVLLVAVFD